jgi:RND family efflux transporter MFP subunit
VSKQTSFWVQLPLLAALLGVAGALWVARDHVVAVFAKSNDAQPGKGKRAARGGDKGVPVIVARVRNERDNQTILAIGTTRAKRFVTLHAEAEGQIVAFFVQSGQRIRKDQPVLRLDDRKAKLLVRMAETKLLATQRLLDRSESLRQRKVNSKARVDDARTIADRAELELQLAKEALGDLTLRAPFDGILGIPKVEAGDRVTVATPIITLDDRSQLVVEFEIPERFLSRLSLGQKLTGETPGFAGQTVQGHIAKIDSRIDPASRTILVWAALPNTDDKLRPGMSFTMRLALSGRTYPAIPELALQWRKGASFVWRVKNGKVEKLPVRTVKRLNSVILVDGKLSKDDVVVVEGIQRLRPGRAVRFVQPAKAGNS